MRTARLSGPARRLFEETAVNKTVVNPDKPRRPPVSEIVVRVPPVDRPGETVITVEYPDEDVTVDKRYKC